MGSTRQDLRRRIGGITGDLDLWTSTGAGSTTTFVDSLNGFIESNSLKGRFGFFSGGTAANLYRTVRVTANTRDTTTLTFTPAVTSTTTTGDVLELYNRDGQGPKPDEIHRAINACIESVSRASLTEALDDAETFSADSPTIAIPATWRRLIAVERRIGSDSTDDWEAVPEEDLLVDRVGYTVRVDNYSRYLADTYSVRLRGYTKAAALTDDTTETSVDAEWLVHQAASQLLLNLATSERVPRDRAAAYRATSQYLQGRADSYRVKVPSTLHGSTGWVLGT